MNEPRVRSTISRRIDGFFAPLQEPLRVCERTFFFGVAGRGKKENFRLDLFRLQLAALNFSRIAPKLGWLCFHHLANDEPFYFRHRLPLPSPTWRANRRT